MTISIKQGEMHNFRKQFAIVALAFTKHETLEPPREGQLSRKAWTQRTHVFLDGMDAKNSERKEAQSKHTYIYTPGTYLLCV